MKRCKGRKEKGCLEEKDLCSWNGTSCSSKVTTTTTKIRCAGRKEKGCLEVPDKCSWNETSCSSKVIPEKTTIRCAARKEKGCNEALTVCSWNNETKKCSAHSLSAKASASPTKVHAIANRHCMYFGNKIELLHKTKVNLNTCLKETYDPKFKSDTNVHLGQRKLMLSEIQLLLEYYKKNAVHPTIVYIGAAPGTHLLHLSEMFPFVKFVLFDGAVFDKRLHEWPNVYEIHEGKKGFFTTEKCKDLKAHLTRSKINNIIFISDIRLGNEDSEMFEKGILKDMELQKEWVQIMKPKLSLLKFRMAYTMKHGDYLDYLKGDILYGIWPKQQSGETRLLVQEKDNNKIIKYDFKSYEETMFFHNKYVRPYCFTTKYEKYVNAPNNIYCPCYDCLSELKILDSYSKLNKVKLDHVIVEFGKFMNHVHKPAFLSSKNNITNKKTTSIDGIVKTKCT